MTFNQLMSFSIIFIFISQANLRLIHRVKEHDPYHNHDCPSYLGCYNSSSTLGNFSKAIIATDANGCSEVGKKLLLKEGSAVDAAIGVLLCMGVVTPESMGLGGGCMMVIYDEKTGKSLVINGREHAPAAAHKDMFHGNATLSNTGKFQWTLQNESHHEINHRRIIHSSSRRIICLPRSTCKVWQITVERSIRGCDRNGRERFPCWKTPRSST